MKKIELLAPAGSYEALVAAVQSGADAVYFGGKNFGARAFANNFDKESIKKAIAYAHIRGVKAYITVNTLIFDSEINEFLDYIGFLYENDADAIILQDIGMVSAIRPLFPDFEIHASTQMSIANLEDALFYQSMGFKRIVLARENSAEEIAHIKKNVDIEIESFVHGALCVSYSGKCLFSYVKGGRSANRGECAQPCRQRYHVTNSKKTIGSDHFLSTRDLCTIGDLKKIVDNGTDSLKIEGRMKRHEYVATVVKSYREALDALYAGQTVDHDALITKMANVFNRKFTKGFILNEEAKDIVNSQTPNNIGTHLGTVEKLDKRNKKVTIKLDQELSVGDGLSLGEHVGRILINNQIVDQADKGDLITLDYIGEAKAGDPIRKTSDKKILDEAKNYQQKEFIKIPLYMNLSIKKDQSPVLVITDHMGHEVTFRDHSLVAESAKTNALSQAIVESQLSKLESTPYYMKELSIDMEEDVFLKISTLNHLRREAVEMLDQARSIRNHRPKKVHKASIDNYLKEQSSVFENKEKNKKISVYCKTKDQVDACADYPDICIYAEDESIYRYADSSNLKAFFVTPIILKDWQIKDLDSFIEEAKPNILTTSLGYAKYVHECYHKQGIQREIRLDYMSNCANYLTYKYIDSMDYISSATMSIETSSLLSTDVALYEQDKIELPILLHPILMVCEFCPYKTKNKCKSCSVDELKMTSDPRGNHNIAIKKDLYCRMILVDEKLWDNRSAIAIAEKHQIFKYRIDLLKETKNEVKTYLSHIIGK